MNHAQMSLAPTVLFPSGVSHHPSINNTYHVHIDNSSYIYHKLHMHDHSASSSVFPPSLCPSASTGFDCRSSNPGGAMLGEGVYSVEMPSHAVSVESGYRATTDFAYGVSNKLFAPVFRAENSLEAVSLAGTADPCIHADYCRLHMHCTYDSSSDDHIRSSHVAIASASAWNASTAPDPAYGSASAPSARVIGSVPATLSTHPHNDSHLEYTIILSTQPHNNYHNPTSPPGRSLIGSPPGRKYSRRGRNATITELRLSCATANVCTLDPNGGHIGEGMLVSGKVSRLEESFHNKNIHIVGIQETRIRSNSSRGGEHYRMLSSGAKDNGTQGCQLWIALELKAKVLVHYPVSPRLLVVVAKIAERQLLFVVAHVPSQGSCENPDDFYASIDSAVAYISSKYSNATHICLIDANGRVGSTPSSGIGEAEPAAEDERGELLRLHIAKHSLYACNTYISCGPTWYHANGSGSRIDYVLFPDSNEFQISDTCVQHDIHLTLNERDDHVVVSSSITFPARTREPRKDPSPPSQPIRKPCKLLMNSPEHISKFRWLLGEPHAFAYDDSASIDANVSRLQQHVAQAMTAFVDPSAKRPHKKWISYNTWSLITAAQKWRGEVKRAREWSLLAKSRVVFRQWLSTIPRIYSKYHTYHVLYDSYVYECKTLQVFGSISYYFKKASFEAKSAIAADKHAYVEGERASANMSASHGNFAPLYKFMRNMGGYTPLPVKSIRKSDGNISIGEVEHDEAWASHFCKLLNAESIDTDTFYNSPNPTPLPTSPCNNTPSPTLRRCFDAISSLPLNKAVGPDGIPAEVMRGAKSFFSKAFYDIITRSWEASYVPLAWRGGRIATLFKKGDSMSPDNYRGLLISDHMSKAYTSIIDDFVNPMYIDHISREQCGGVPGRGTDLANHVVRTFLDNAASAGRSVAVLFIDLTKAFDYVIREHALGWPFYRYDSKERLLNDLGVPRSHVESVIKTIDCDRPLLQQAGVPAHVVNILNSLHSNSWFKIGDHPNLIVARKGGRQGCRFGGKLFNIVYDAALSEVRKLLHAEGLSSEFRGTEGSPIWSKTCSLPHETCLSVCDITFVDDEAVLIDASSADTLLHRLGRAVHIVAQVFHKYNMILNFSKGKTEAIVQLRGRGVNVAKTTLAHRIESDGTRFLRVPSVMSFGDIDLRIVDRYKHLGTIVCPDGNLTPEASQRAASANAAFANLSKNVVGSSSIDVKLRMGVVWSHIFSRLLYNVHIWAKFNGRPRNILNKVYNRVWRRLTDKPRFNGRAMSDKQVRDAERPFRRLRSSQETFAVPFARHRGDGPAVVSHVSTCIKL